eukprot:COSAG02_NODE_1710_length_11224_cov_30.628674_2_plen_3421_part_01
MSTPAPQTTDPSCQLDVAPFEGGKMVSQCRLKGSHPHVYGATACTAAPPRKYDQDLDATTAPLECGHGAPVVCTANFDGTGGVVPCDETRCTRTGNLWSAADLTCRTELGALRGVATCTSTATNTADTPDCALAFATAGNGLPDSCADGCTYREPFDQNACVYTGHVWDAETGTCLDVSGRGYCLDADGDRMVESMSTHDWRDPDLCESVSGRTWVWQQFRGYQTDTLENGGATQCIMCPSGAADTDRTSTTACSTCDPGETTMRCTDASGVVAAAVSEEECTAAPSCGDFTVAEGCPPGCGDDGTECTGDADTPSTTWQAQGATSCLLCPAVMVESCAGTASGDDTGMTCDLDSATDDIATCPSGRDHYQPPADDVTFTTTGNSFGSESYCYASDGSTTISDLDEATCKVEPSPYTWHLQLGATECTACAQGFADVDGISVAACESCPVGTTTVRQNEDGTSSIAIAATVCFPCSDGSYDHDMTATTPCFECSAGKYGQGADDECGDCPSGLYDDDRSSTTPCVTCALGQHSNPGQTYCQYSAQRGVTCASCEKGQTDMDGQATQDLYLSGAGSLPLVARRCIDVDDYSLLADITDEATCVGDAESPTGRTWTSPTPQCLTHFVPGTCTRPSGNTWPEPNGLCLDGNGQEVIVTRPGETLTARQLEAMCTRTAVPIFDEAGCTSLVQDATWSVYEHCAQAQTSPDEITEDMRNADHTSCESQSTDNTFVAGSCTDTSGDTTSHSTEDSCEYEPTSNTWDPSAAAGDECSDSNGNVLPVQPGDESACVQQESGRTWSPGQCFAPDSSLLADLTTQSDCLYTSTANTWFPGICMRNDMVTWMEALIDGILVDVLDEAMCDQMQAECTAITDPWYRVGAYLAERDDMCRTGAVVQELASVQPFALDTCNNAAEYASTHSVTLQAACTAMADVITAAVDADPSHPCANAAAACACVFTPQEVPSAGTPCVQCASGRYTDRLFFGECDECDAGRYDEDADPSTPCEDCFVGRYSSAGQVECIDCAGGTYDHDQNPATTCLDCQVGCHSAPIVHKVCTTASGDIWNISHIEDPVESDCINDLRPDNVWSVYVAGAFGPNGCIGCDFGTADEDLDPATACNQCQPGQFAPQLATGCTDCPQGYGDDDLDPSTPCVQCRVGMFAPAGATNCTGCPPDKHDGDLESTTPCEDCLAGRYSGSGWTNCTNCTTGFADEDQNPATPCDACAPGQYMPEFSIICVDCLAFEYDNDSNPATPCVLCDEGHHTNGLACISCAAGLFDDDTDPGTECESCMIGQYSPMEAVSCTDCAAGAHDHDRDPSTACELCGPGNFSALGDLFCFPCRPGTHDNDTDASTPCVSCPRGTFSEGATECIDCAAGRIDRDFDPASPCVACPPGSYAGEGATVCITCAAGQIDHDQDPATECSACEPGKHSAFGDYKCDACFTGYYDADESAAAPCTRCEAGQFSSKLGRCSAGSTDLFTYFQWSRPLPQTEGECTTASNSNIWSSSFRCVDTDGLTTLPEVTDQSACTDVAGRVWTSGCFSSDGSFVSARITRHECTTDPTGNLWVVAFPGLCDADTNPVDECSSEVTVDTGITQECFDAITESPSAAAFVETLDSCTACGSIDGPADICSACEANILAALARCTPTGAAEHSICVIPTMSEYETCELKSSNNVWFPPVCRTAPTTNTWGGDPPICTDDRGRNSQTAATSEAECVGNAPVIALDETECEIEATGRTWIDGWCNDYARCIDTDGSIAAEFTAESECVIDSTGNTWNLADVLPTGVADINADADTVTFAISQTSLVIGQALQLGHNVPTCDLSAATDGTGDCPAGCLFIDTTTPVCQWEDADALTGCPVGCAEDLNQGTCTGDATPVPATCTGQANAKNCAATVGVDLVISNVQGAQVTFATDILAGDPDALQNCHISRKLCTSDSGLVVEADDQDECELVDSGRSWITPRVAGVTDETTCEWEATGYTWDAVGTCHLLCAYSQGTEGCPEGCTDDGTTCSGETDALHSTIASEAECGGSCVVTPGTSEEEANEATTCTLTIGDCTVATGSGSCAYATSTETVWRTGQCWEGASTVSATNEADCETVRISPARTWVEPYCNDANGNQLSSSAAGTEQVCELAASGNVWSEGYCEAPVESLNPVSVGLSVAEIDDTTNTVTLASVESGISVGDVLHISSAPGQSCQALPLNTDLIVGSVDGAIITFEEATFASADGEVATGDVGAGNNCIIVRLLFSDQGGCEEMPTGNTWWYPYTYCDNCPSGSFDDDMDPTTPCLACIAGEYSPGRTNSCIDCEPGFADAGSNPGTVCTACHTGQYSGDRATVCWDCQAGEKDVDSDLSTPCVACNAGQFAAVASTTCATCDAGQADLDSDPATACASCPAGKFAASGSTSCAVFSTGQVDHDSDASTACESCVVGEYSAPGETACSICAAGTHDDDSDPGTPCVACPPGTETLAEGRCLDASRVVTALNAGADDEERCESVRNTNTWTPAACTQNSDSSPVVDVTSESVCEVESTGRFWDGSNWLEGRCWATLQQTVSGINPGAQTVTTANAETSVVAGVKLQLADAPGQSCLATPLDTDLEVESRVGSTITFVPGSTTAGDAASAANCVLREPVTAANQPDCEENPLPRTWTDPGCYDASGVSLAGTVENNDIGSCTTESSGHIWNEGVCTKSDLSLDTEATDEYSCLVEVTNNMEFSAAFCTLTDGTQSERTRSDCETATDSVWTYARCSDARSPIDNDEATCYQQDRPNTWHPESCEDENFAPVTPTPESEVLCERDPTGNSWQPVGSYCADCVAGRADIDSDGGAETSCDVCPSGTYAPVRSTVCEPCPSGTYDTETACTSKTGAVVVAETEAECLGSCTVLPGTTEEEAAEETTCELSVSSCAVATGSGSCEYVTSSNTWFLTASTPCVACAIGRVAVDAVTNCDACADGLADVDSVYAWIEIGVRGTANAAGVLVLLLATMDHKLSFGGTIGTGHVGALVVAMMCLNTTLGEGIGSTERPPLRSAPLGKGGTPTSDGVITLTPNILPRRALQRSSNPACATSSDGTQNGGWASARSCTRYFGWGYTCETLIGTYEGCGAACEACGPNGPDWQASDATHDQCNSWQLTAHEDGWGDAAMHIHASGVLQIENFIYVDDEYVTAGVAEACLHPSDCYEITVDGPTTARWSIHDAFGIVVVEGSAPFSGEVCHCSAHVDLLHYGGDVCSNCTGLAMPVGGTRGDCSLDGTLEHDRRCLQTCAEGSKSLPTTCFNGTMRAPEGCCAAGSSWNGEGGVACEPCEAGRYDGDSDPSTPCDACPTGTYSDVVAATECAPCDIGSYSPSGSNSTSGCVECTAGTYDGDSDPSTPCDACPMGTYSDVVAATECAPCDIGSYSPSGSSSTLGCVECTAGTYDGDSDPSTPCDACPMGTYS